MQRGNIVLRNDYPTRLQVSTASKWSASRASGTIRRLLPACLEQDASDALLLFLIELADSYGRPVCLAYTDASLIVNF
jgi:hypothetical protein